MNDHISLVGGTHVCLFVQPSVRPSVGTSKVPRLPLLVGFYVLLCYLAFYFKTPKILLSTYMIAIITHIQTSQIDTVLHTVREPAYFYKPLEFSFHVTQLSWLKYSSCRSKK